MSAISPHQARAMRNASGQESKSESSLAAKWRDIHEQAAQLAKLANLSPEPFAGAIADFPDRIASASAWQRDLAGQAVDDIDAMMRPGLVALATLHERGVGANAPALALWREFYDARMSVIELVDRSQSAEQ